MNVVVDASVIIAVIAGEPEREALIALTQEADLIAPHSVHWEIGNAFSAMLKRNRVTLEQVLKAIEIYQTIPIRLFEVELNKALELAAQHSLYAYDAYLLQCALKYQSPLISLDKRLIEIARQMKVEVWEVN
jgi:predicted nucleic acid-binding protein